MSFVRRGINTRVAVAAVVAVAFGALFTGAAGAAVPKAKLLPGGRAVAPPSAPPAVRAMIAAANHIRHRPYVWGGGHRKWRSRGYDCSGSVSYVLHAGGLLDYPLDSTGFMRYGEGGGDQWVQIYANHKHAFMIIAGLRWDTAGITDGDPSGPGWSTVLPTSTKGYRERQPLDLETAVPLWHP
jgi:cell wall-associated NlpC family hydrolase